MSVRVRKFIGLVAIVVFILLYVGLMVRIGEYVPDHWAAQLAFYALAGLGWGAPIVPLITWMNRES